MTLLLKNQTAEELAQSCAAWGVSAKIARRIQAAILRRGANEIPARLDEVSPRLLERLRAAARVPHLRLVERAVSAADGFVKYLFSGDGPERFEAVRIPLLHRPDQPKYIVCVSSQAGCALGCAFCATARLGFQRNLATWEIVDQVLKVQADSSYPVRGVVFMGMGEPMLNYESVMRAAAVLCEPCGPAIAAKAITISTVGIIPGIRRFTADKQPYRLIVSLTSADSAQRQRLMPIEQAYPLPSLIAAVREYQAASGRRVTFAWTLMRGVNTSRRHARQLAELTAGMPIQLDLIDVNDPTGQFQPPGTEELAAFRDALRSELGMPVQRRYSGGQDVHAGCGMLAGALVTGELPPRTLAGVDHRNQAQHSDVHQCENGGAGVDTDRS